MKRLTDDELESAQLCALRGDTFSSDVGLALIAEVRAFRTWYAEDFPVVETALHEAQSRLRALPAELGRNPDFAGLFASGRHDLSEQTGESDDREDGE